MILVTGAAGFIGSYLTRALLNRGEKVIGIDNFSDYYPRRAKEFNLDLIRMSIGDNPVKTDLAEIRPIADIFAQYYGYSESTHGSTASFEFAEVDIRDNQALAEIFEKYRPKKVIHLAAMAGVDLSTQEPGLYTEVNNLGSVNLLNLAKENSVEKFVFGSSSSVYGARENVPFKESDDVDAPVSPYAATKRMQEIMNYTFHFLYGISIINARIFGPIYGPLQRPYRMLAQRFINLTYHDKPMTIFGDGQEGGRDTTYIDDEVEGLIKCLDSDIDFDTINIGSGKVITPGQTAEAVIKLMGKGEVIHLDRPKSEVPVTFAEVTKAKKLLDFEAKWDFEVGLARQIKVFMKMPDWYKNMST